MAKKKKSLKTPDHLKPKKETGPKYKIRNVESNFYAYPGDGLPHDEALRLAQGLVASHEFYLEEVAPK